MKDFQKPLTIRCYTNDVITKETVIPGSQWYAFGMNKASDTIDIGIIGSDEKYKLPLNEFWEDDPTVRIFINTNNTDETQIDDAWEKFNSLIDSMDLEALRFASEVLRLKIESRISEIY